MPPISKFLAFDIVVSAISGLRYRSSDYDILTLPILARPTYDIVGHQKTTISYPDIDHRYRSLDLRYRRTSGNVPDESSCPDSERKCTIWYITWYPNLNIYWYIVVLIYIITCNHHDSIYYLYILKWWQVFFSSCPLLGLIWRSNLTAHM